MESNKKEEVNYPEAKEFDFSIFHPLDHHWWEPYCWKWHGGILRHWQLWWECIAEEAIKRNTLCRVGKHFWGKHWQKNLEREWIACSFCHKEK